MKVVVCGGGIAGLALALSLHAAGIDVEVFEAHPEIEELGVGINVLPARGARADRARPGRRAGGRGRRDQRAGRCSTGTGRGSGASRAGLADGYRWPQYSIHRGRLLGVLYRAAARAARAPIACTPAAEGVEHSQDDRSATLHLADGASATGDVARRRRRPRLGDAGAALPGRGGAALERDHDVPRRSPLAEPSARRQLDGPDRALPAGAPSSIRSPRATRTAATQVNLVLDAKLGDGRPMPRQDWKHEVDRDEVRELFGDMRFDWIDLGRADRRDRAVVAVPDGRPRSAAAMVVRPRDADR